MCLIFETHSTEQTYIKLRGYKVYKTTHPGNQAKDGSVVVIRDSINHYEERHIRSMEAQLTVIGIKSIKQRLTVGALYYSPI